MCVFSACVTLKYTEQQLKRTFVVSFTRLIWEFFLFYFFGKQKGNLSVTGVSDKDRAVDMHGKHPSPWLLVLPSTFIVGCGTY